MKQNSPIRVLLVEDNPDHVEITMGVLQAEDCISKIDVVADGEQAINYLHGMGDYNDREKYPTPDLILLDINLPKVDGIEVLKHIKNDSVLRKIPVIILTTSESDRDIEEAYDKGANSYIAKPVSSKDFIAKIRDMGFYWAETNILLGAKDTNE